MAYAVTVAFYFAAREPRPADHALVQVEVETPPAAIDCKRCSCCEETKPLTEFYVKATAKTGYTSACKLCTSKHTKALRVLEKIGPIEPSLESKAAKLEAIASEASTAVSGLVTMDGLTLAAKQSKNHRAVYQVGRMRIDAIYDKRTGEIEYRVGGWPCYPEDVAAIFEDLHSGHPLRVQV